MFQIDEFAAVWRPANQAIHEIKNIFCVGRNYRAHATELGNDIPTQPLVFGKSTHALAAAKQFVQLPSSASSIHHEIELVLYIGAPYHKGISVDELVSGVALGLDLTKRDTQNTLKLAGHPWELAKGFPGSAVITDFYAVESLQALNRHTFSLELDGLVVQSGSPAQMIFDFQTLVDYVGVHFGLDNHDILYTGTPKGVGPLANHQVVRMLMDGNEWGKFEVQICERTGEG